VKGAKAVKAAKAEMHVKAAARAAVANVVTAQKARAAAAATTAAHGVAATVTAANRAKHVPARPPLLPRPQPGHLASARNVQTARRAATVENGVVSAAVKGDAARALNAVSAPCQQRERRAKRQLCRHNRPLSTACPLPTARRPARAPMATAKAAAAAGAAAAETAATAGVMRH